MADLSGAAVVVRAERGIGGMIAKSCVVLRGPARPWHGHKRPTPAGKQLG